MNKKGRERRRENDRESEGQRERRGRREGERERMTGDDRRVNSYRGSDRESCQDKGRGSAIHNNDWNG